MDDMNCTPENEDDLEAAEMRFLQKQLELDTKNKESQEEKNKFEGNYLQNFSEIDDIEAFFPGKLIRKSDFPEISRKKTRKSQSVRPVPSVRPRGLRQILKDFQRKCPRTISYDIYLNFLRCFPDISRICHGFVLEMF